MPTSKNMVISNQRKIHLQPCKSILCPSAVNPKYSRAHWPTSVWEWKAESFLRLSVKSFLGMPVTSFELPAAAWLPFCSRPALQWILWQAGVRGINTKRIWVTKGGKTRHLADNKGYFSDKRWNQENSVHQYCWECRTEIILWVSRKQQRQTVGEFRSKWFPSNAL